MTDREIGRADDTGRDARDRADRDELRTREMSGATADRADESKLDRAWARKHVET